MTFDIVVEPEAIAEITAAVLWYESERLGLGQEFSDAVWQEIESLRRFPNAGSPAYEVERTPVARPVLSRP